MVPNPPDPEVRAPPQGAGQGGLPTYRFHVLRRFLVCCCMFVSRGIHPQSFMTDPLVLYHRRPPKGPAGAPGVCASRNFPAIRAKGDPALPTGSLRTRAMVLCGSGAPVYCKGEIERPFVFLRLFKTYGPPDQGWIEMFTRGWNIRCEPQAETIRTSLPLVNFHPQRACSVGIMYNDALISLGCFRCRFIAHV